MCWRRVSQYFPEAKGLFTPRKTRGQGERKAWSHPSISDNWVFGKSMILNSLRVEKADTYVSNCSVDTWVPCWKALRWHHYQCGHPGRFKFFACDQHFPIQPSTNFCLHSYQLLYSSNCLTFFLHFVSIASIFDQAISPSTYLFVGEESWALEKTVF